MIEGATSTGFQFKIEDDAADDYELVEVLTEIDNGEWQKVTEMTTRLLGPEQRDALKEHVRGENGRVSFKEICNEVGEIFVAANKTKN